jgi:hypothetical protein
MAGKTPNLNSPLHEIGINLSFASKEEMIYCVQCYAYARRRNHIQFDVRVDNRSGSRLKFSCGPGCDWCITCKVERKDQKIVRVTVIDSTGHNELCAGSKPKPSLEWLSKNSSLRVCAYSALRGDTVIKHAMSMGLIVTLNQANRLRRELKKQSMTEFDYSYGILLPWLQEFCAINPGAQYEFRRNDVSKRFEYCFLLLPSVPIVKNSCLGTFMIDCGFSIDPQRRLFQCYLVTMGDREGRDTPIAIGFKPTEDSEGFV